MGVPATSKMGNMGFEEEDEEGQDTNESGKDDLEVGLFQILVSEVPLVLLFFC